MISPFGNSAHSNGNNTLGINGQENNRLTNNVLSTGIVHSTPLPGAKRTAPPLSPGLLHSPTGKTPFVVKSRREEHDGSSPFNSSGTWESGYASHEALAGIGTPLATHSRHRSGSTGSRKQYSSDESFIRSSPNTTHSPKQRLNLHDATSRSLDPFGTCEDLHSLYICDNDSSIGSEDDVKCSRRKRVSLSLCRKEFKIPHAFKVSQFPVSINPYLGQQDTNAVDLLARDKHVHAEDVKVWCQKGRKVHLDLVSEVDHLNKSFHIIDEIGKGDFGWVVRVIHRLDGAHYAIKVSQEKGKLNRGPSAMKEVWALRALVGCPFIIRYFTSWIDGKTLYIQTEFCSVHAGTLVVAAVIWSPVTESVMCSLGGSLADILKKGEFLEEDELLRMLRNVGQGLKFMHARGIAHMDIKPENILVARIEDDDDDPCLYKIGDLGHACKADASRDWEEGDRRYMAPELLGDLVAATHGVTKADVFSLGLTAHSLGRGEMAADSGGQDAARWHSNRENALQPVPRVGLPLNTLLADMCLSDPAARLSASDVVERAAAIGASHHVTSMEI